MHRPFRVNVSSVLRSGERRRERRRGEILDLYVTASEVPVGGEVEVDVELVPVGRTVEVTGVVRAPWEAECRRCLGPVRGALEAPVREVFEPNNEEGETYPLARDEIDLEVLARETVMLELPPAPLCQETCQGFCPTCGANRNHSQCSCVLPLDPRWSVLEGLYDGD